MTRPRSDLGLLLAFSLALAVVACGSAPRTSFYTVDYPAPSASAVAAVGSRAGVAKPQANHLLRQDRIVYFTEGSQLNYYQYHRWAQPPPALVQDLLIRQVRAAGLFDDVVPYRAQKGLDYVLRGELLAMEEVDAGTDVKARFGLSLELVRQKDAHVVWTGRHSCERPVGTKTMEAVVDTIGGCAEETLNQLSQSMGVALEEIKRADAADEEKR